MSMRDNVFREWLSAHYERANPKLQTVHKVAFDAGWDAQQARIDTLTKELKWCIFELEREGSRRPYRVRRAGRAKIALEGLGTDKQPALDAAIDFGQEFEDV